jgi:hypothetical protein
MSRRTRSTLRTALFALLQLLLLAAPTFAQTTTEALAAQSLRPYWHVFIAYALAWLFVGGWLFSVGKRLSRIEEALNK